MEMFKYRDVMLAIALQFPGLSFERLNDDFEQELLNCVLGSRRTLNFCSPYDKLGRVAIQYFDISVLARPIQ